MDNTGKAYFWNSGKMYSKRPWTQEHIDTQRAYFEKERTEKKGNFAEFVVRMYYLIYKACVENDGSCCKAKEVRPYRVKDEIYEGIYDSPDHAFRTVINDCTEHLKLMHYIGMRKNEKDEWMIYLNRPLDFLLEGEHEEYLKKYGITGQAHFQSEP